ncbi:DUF3108 domain-containing protein [Candidatus Proelusimicrobium excrementi]|uniref:DUF3108 domain-containing protein n=1 Tax=Candidatus Proelusimicrobium excrementi TaxID=3416222 RepID=UPI003CB9E540|nr:DUF3108 domain-containing protein [Elusimicrobiaceae bacterium]
MRFLFILLITAVLTAPGCGLKNKKDDGLQTKNAEQTQPQESSSAEKSAAPAQENDSAEPATFAQSVIKFFSPSPSPSAKKAEEEKAKQTSLTKSGNSEKQAELSDETQPKEAQPAQEEEPQFPEYNAADDPKAIILKTEDGRLTSPFYFSEDAKPEQTKNLKKPVWLGETLKYNVGWSFIVAGTATLTTGRIVDNNGVLAYELRADAKSHSIIDAVFKVRDINISWLDVNSLKSLGYWQSVREGKYARDEWLILDYNSHTYNNHKQDKQGNVKTQQFTFTGDSVLDMLSSLYYVRLQPLPEKGVVYFDIINRKQQYPLKVTVLGKKKVKVKAGEFNCIVVEPQFSGEGIFISKGKSLKVWLTDDERRLPVKMAAEVFIGSVTAELAEYSVQTGESSEEQKAG